MIMPMTDLEDSGLIQILEPIDDFYAVIVARAAQVAIDPALSSENPAA